MSYHPPKARRPNTLSRFVLYPKPRTVVPLIGGDRFQDPLWMLEMDDNTEPSIFPVCTYLLKLDLTVPSLSINNEIEQIEQSTVMKAVKVVSQSYCAVYVKCDVMPKLPT